MKTLVAALLLTSMPAFAADVTGKYTGIVEFQNANGESRKSDAYMDLKQEGEKLTGVAGPSSMETIPIQNGKVDGDTLTFEVAPDHGPVLKIVLKHADGKLTGEATGDQDGRIMKAKFKLSRK
jgi:hypothetical protein